MSWLIQPLFYNWLIVGAVLLIVELLTFTFLFLWLAVAASVVAVIVYVAPELAISTQLYLYSFLSLMSLVLWFKLFRESTMNRSDNGLTNQRMARYLNQETAVVQSVSERIGKVNLEDSFWRVEANEPIAVGDIVRLVSIDELSFKVEKK